MLVYVDGRLCDGEGFKCLSMLVALQYLVRITVTSKVIHAIPKFWF